MADKSAGNKVKKSKNDLLRTTVGYYLKQKNYVGNDKYRKSDFLLLQNKRQFMVQKMLEIDLQDGNSFAYSNVLCITNNQHIVDQQFGRFSQFVESQDEFIRSELRRFYAPMLCHLYMELLKAREQKAGVELLRKYAQLVAPVETYDAPLPTKINGCSVPNDSHGEPAAAAPHTNIRFVCPSADEETENYELGYFIKLIQTLSSCTKLETAESDPDVALFCTTKYEIHTTELVVDTLLTYLEKRGHVLILNLLYTWFQVHIVDNEVRRWTEDYLFLGFGASDDEDDDTDDEQPAEIKPKTAVPERSGTKRPIEIDQTEGQAENTEEDKDDLAKQHAQKIKSCMQILQECKEEILKKQTLSPNFIKLADRSRGLTSAYVDANGCHLVAGFNSSVVQLWQMNQLTCSGENLYRPFSEKLCPWEVNNCSPIETEENEIDLDIQKDEKGHCSDRRKRKFDECKYEANSFNEYGGIELRGHGLGVTDVRFSAHYPLIYSTSKDATMRSWRADSYTCSRIYRGHRYPIWCVDESPVGMYIATGSKDLTARLWSLERDFPLITYAGHTQDVECMAFHPNGNYIATGSADLSVRLWCVTSGKLMRVFSDCKQPVTSIVFSPDGKMLAAGGEETKIRIFDLAAGSQLNELKEHTAAVSSIAWCKNGRYLASACRDGTLRLWDVKKLTPPNESTTNASSTSSSSSSSATVNRLFALNSNCHSLVKVMFNKENEAVCGIGS